MPPTKQHHSCGAHMFVKNLFCAHTGSSNLWNDSPMEVQLLSH